MNRYHTIKGVFFGAMMALILPICAQEVPSPEHRFAIRLNLVGLASFNPIAEIEYKFSNRIGVFIGGGSPQPILELGHIDWFTPHWYNQKMWGLYAGANITVPMGPFKHLSIKPIVAYTCHPKFDSASWPIDLPYPTRHSRSELGTYINVAYAQPLGSGFFVEPVIGFGAAYTLFKAGDGGLEFQHLQVPVQLNLGFKF